MHPSFRLVRGLAFCSQFAAPIPLSLDGPSFDTLVCERVFLLTSSYFRTLVKVHMRIVPNGLLQSLCG